MALVKSLNKQLIINKASDHNIANQLKIMQKITKKEEWRTIYQVNRLWPILIGKHLKVFVKDAQTIITLNSVEELKPKANEIFFAFADYFSPTS
jgi:predicted ribosome-associated RNA-binding protein Tma20